MMNSRGVYSCGSYGYVVKVNEDGESVTWHFDAGNTKEKKIYTSKIDFSCNDKPYFRTSGVIIYLDDYLRIGTAG